MLKTAIHAAQEAGKRIAHIYESYKIEDIVEYKTDNSPLTLADKEAHRSITTHLQALGYPILSEEGKQVAYQERKNWKTYWLIDPLDGTREFVKRNGNFTVNIALIENNQPTMGVIYVPVERTTYFAQLNSTNELENKAFKIDATGKQTQIEVSPRSNQDGIIAFKSRSFSSTYDDTYLERFNVKETIKKGSSVKFCLVAEGIADIYYRNGTTMEWDTAAGEVILKAAGGQLIDAQTYQPLQYNKENLENPSFCAINKGLAVLFT